MSKTYATGEPRNIAHKLYSKGYDDGAAKYIRADAKTAYLTEDEAVAAIQAYGDQREAAGRRDELTRIDGRAYGDDYYAYQQKRLAALEAGKGVGK